MVPQDFEKLGAFYLGREYDLESRQRRPELVLYDSKDLVTHAVCVGMTGSGKTGLCLSLLEEAAIDGVPSILIDPKGDLGNLLLAFPGLSAGEFRPWINEDEARKKGLTPDEFAAQQAALWAKGLGEWGQDGARIARLKAAADVAIYTPGSTAGLPVSVLKSFAAPPPALIEDEELLGERVSSTATSLLGLLGVDADPIQSREHILLSTIFDRAWRDGRAIELASLIHQIQEPPVTRVGVMELETFFPSKDRFALAMQLNNLVASPGFARWMEGEALDVGALLHTSTGQPRVSIFSIAHLTDAERMFFVSLLLNQVLGWVRTQSGTTSLRAILYMDEIAGYFPPVANPPSKRPLLTLMKQARAFGVGVVLATQNPVDLDYKGLANAGTWFIGRLQTDRDKQRVLDGLEGAASSASTSFDRASADRALSALGSRVFLMNNVHDTGPTIFETRWVMSYLRGPLTRAQIKQLMDVRRGGAPAPAPRAQPTSSAAGAEPLSAVAPHLARSAASGPSTSGVPAGNAKPVLPPEVPQYFLPARGAPGEGARLAYRPALLGFARVYYSDTKAKVEGEELVAYLATIGSGPVAVDWDQSEPVELSESDVEREHAPGAVFEALPPEASKAKSYEAWKKSLTDMLFRKRQLEVLRSPSTGEPSRPGENEREFRARLVQRAREERDAAVAKLRAKYAPKVQTLQERVRRAEQQLAVQKEQSSQSKMSTAISFGAAVLGAFLGKKVASAGNVGKAATAARGVGRSMKESSDVGRAEENVEAVRAQLAELEAAFNAEVGQMSVATDPAVEQLESLTVKPKKTNIQVRAVFLVWEPMVAASGQAAAGPGDGAWSRAW